MLYSLIEASERCHHKNIRSIEVVSRQPHHLLGHCLISKSQPGLANSAVVPPNCSGAICSRSGTHRRCPRVMLQEHYVGTLSRNRTASIPGSVQPPPNVYVLAKRPHSVDSFLIHFLPPAISGAGLEGQVVGINYLNVMAHATS